MFEKVLVMYKKYVKKKVPRKIVFIIIMMVVGVIATFISQFVIGIWLAVIGLLLIVSSAVGLIVFSNRLEEETKVVLLREGIFERYESIKCFLKENKILEKDICTWLIECCNENLNEKKNSKQYFVPFVSGVMFPIFLLVIKELLGETGYEENSTLLGIVIICAFVVYLSAIIVETSISDICNNKFYYVKRLKEDLVLYKSINGLMEDDIESLNELCKEDMIEKGSKE